MIIKCESCSRKFIVKDKDIPRRGRTVQCGFCSIKWHQMPVKILKDNQIQDEEESVIKKPLKKDSSIDNIKASDGKIYKSLGSQWAQLLPSGKTGIFAKKKISMELNKKIGRDNKIINKKIKINRNFDPSLQRLSSDEQLPDLYNPKNRMGFFGYMFLLIIVSVSAIGIIKTFEEDWLNYFPQNQYIFDLLDKQLEYIFETFRNIVTIIKDLTNSY